MPDSVHLLVMDCHHLGFCDETFDFIAGRAILHHLNIESSLKEIHRVLKPGGIALFYEPLGDNPAGKLFRSLTRKARTSDERPLSRKDILFGEKLFSSSNHLSINFFSTIVGICTSLLPLGGDNYLLRLADMIDRKLENTIFKYWMRQVILVWKK